MNLQYTKIILKGKIQPSQQMMQMSVKVPIEKMLRFHSLFNNTLSFQENIRSVFRLALEADTAAYQERVPSTPFYESCNDREEYLHCVEFMLEIEHVCATLRFEIEKADISPIFEIFSHHDKIDYFHHHHTCIG